MSHKEDQSRIVSSNDIQLAKPEPVFQSPRDTNLRWLTLVFCCLSTIGGYYSHDAAGALQTYIMKDFDIDGTTFNFVFTAYSLPNLVMPIFGGVIIDKLGVRFGLAIFACVICLGQAIVTLGTYKLSWTIVLIGTGVMGAGLDSLCAAQNTMVVKWFGKKQLSLAMGLTLTTSRLGSSVSAALAPAIYDSTKSLGYAMGFGVILAFFSMLIAGVLFILDAKTDEKEEKMRSDSGKKAEKSKFSFSDIKNFKLIYFLVVLNCMVAYGAIKGFLNNANDIMNNRFGFEPELSGKYLMVVFVMACIFSPIFGLVIDKIGRRVTLLLGSFFFLALVHLGVVFMPDTEKGDPNKSILIILVGIGFAFSAYAAVIWPSLSLVVDRRTNGTAFGCTFALQNLMLSILPIVLGVVHDKTKDVHHGYWWTEVLLMILAVFGIIITVILYFEDKKTGARLESAPNAQPRPSQEPLVAVDEETTKQ